MNKLEGSAGILHVDASLYAFYKQRHPDGVSYTCFRAVVRAYFRGIVGLLLTGWVWNIGVGLGKMRIKRVKRRFKNPMPNWGETKKLHAERPELPKDVLVYYTEQPHYYRFFWDKYRYNCTLPNNTIYGFRPTQGPNGNARTLAHLLSSNELAHLNFKD